MHSRVLLSFTASSTNLLSHVLLARLHTHVDFVVCLGGDGVLLHASALFRHAIPPVISFNLGSLGFLTNHDYRYFRSDLRDVIYGCEDLDECSLPEEEMKVTLGSTWGAWV